MYHYQHHIGDFNNATRHLSRIERSIYRDLIELYYDTESKLPNDLAWICRKIIANECSTDVERMLNEFFTKTQDGWYHSRCEHEIHKYRESSSKKSIAGRASAAKREVKMKQAFNGCSTDAQQEFNGCSTGVQLTDNRKPITVNQEPNKKTLSASADVVEVFEHWKIVMGHPMAKLDDKRKRLITMAMKIGYTTDSLCAAIDGCAKSSYHMGQNERSAKYDSLDLILRNADKIDSFIAIGRDCKKDEFFERHTDKSWRSGLDVPVAKGKAEIRRDQPVVATVVAGGAEIYSESGAEALGGKS